MSRSAIRFAGACAALSAVTTFFLWLLPRIYGSPATFEAAVALHANPYYMGRLWVNFIHIFLALAGYGATAYLLFRLAPSLSIAGFVSFFMWGFTELLGVTVNIFAVNRTWRTQFAAASPDAKLQIRTNVAGFQAVWDGMFFLLLVAFLVASACYGMAALRGDRLTRTIGVLFLLGVPLTAAIMLGEYTSFTGPNAIVAVVYPVLQPVSRSLLGYWLWRGAN